MADAVKVISHDELLPGVIVEFLPGRIIVELAMGEPGHGEALAAMLLEEIATRGGKRRKLIQ